MRTYALLRNASFFMGSKYTVSNKSNLGGKGNLWDKFPESINKKFMLLVKPLGICIHMAWSYGF